MQRDERLKERITKALAGFSVLPLSQPGKHQAAVALAIVDEAYGPDVKGMQQCAGWSTRAALVLTRRSGRLNSHAGQWALPGGRIDAGESAEQAALRELQEEVGLQLDGSAVLGRLDDFSTRSGFVITPVVVWAGAVPDMTANPAEVASIHRIGLTEFMRGDAPMLETVPESRQPVLRMPVGERWIAAPTAAFLYQFRELCLRGRPTRVAHFEQPVFAWK